MAGAVPMRAVASAVAMRVAAVLLGAGSLVWAALPAVHRGWSGFALVLAIAGVAAGGLRLALAAVPVPEDSYWPSPGLRVWRAFLEVVRQVPWEEGAVIGIVWLEVLHPSRPWHTAVLGAGLIAYLLIAHLAESDAPPATLRPQARVLGLGAALLALGAGAGMLPAAGPGAGSALLRLVAAGALIVAAGLVLPYVSRRLPPETMRRNTRPRRPRDGRLPECSRPSARARAKSRSSITIARAPSARAMASRPLIAARSRPSLVVARRPTRSTGTVTGMPRMLPSAVTTAAAKCPALTSTATIGACLRSPSDGAGRSGVRHEASRYQRPDAQSSAMS